MGQRRLGGFAAFPQAVEEFALAGGEVRARRAPVRAAAEEGEGGRGGDVLADRAGRRRALAAAGEVAGDAAGAHRGQRDRLGRGEPPRRLVGGELLAHGAQLLVAGPDGEPGQQPEDGDHERGVDDDEAVAAEGGRAVPEAVQDHRGEQRRDRQQDAADALVPGGRGGQAEADAGHGGEQGVREGGHHAADEERRGGGGPDARVAELLVADERRAEIEDVLGEGEPGGRDSGDDDAVHDPVEVASSEHEEEEHGGRLGALLHERRDEGGPPGVGVGAAARGRGVRDGRHEPFGREAVRDERDERRGACAPGEGEDQVPPGFRVDAVEPAEYGDDQRYGQHGEAEPHQETLGAGLLAYEGQDDQTGERQQSDERGGAQGLVVPEAAETARSAPRTRVPGVPGVSRVRPASRNSRAVEPRLLVVRRDRRIRRLVGGRGLMHSTDPNERGSGRLRDYPHPRRGAMPRCGGRSGHGRYAPCPGPGTRTW